MSASVIYVTTKDKQQALDIGGSLVQDRLVACVNILDGMTSMYWWEGQVQQESEAVLIAKTRSDLVEEVIARIKSLHSYDCPCVISLPIPAGNEDYLKWIEQETR